ncbi:MAG: FG-GAP repeat protein, partial [Candidatus Thermoplasmatota archaeon]|nr:FG-GAP repeat protein [Candidatus Thermoplasmatota archaeon]
MIFVSFSDAAQFVDIEGEHGYGAEEMKKEAEHVEYMHENETGDRITNRTMWEGSDLVVDRLNAGDDATWEQEEYNQDLSMEDLHSRLWLEPEADIDIEIDGGLDSLSGWNLTTVDLNNDEHHDVVVGGPDNESKRGVVHIYFGANLTENVGPEDADVTIEGESGGDKFGWDVAGTADVTGNGYNDTVVGAPGKGNVYLFEGRDTWSSSLTLSDAEITIEGSSDAGFGRAVGGKSDLNSDGYADIIVGAPSWDGRGNATVYFGGGFSLPSSLTPNDADVIMKGRVGSNSFGFSVASAGNVNGTADVDNDFIVGAPYDNGTGRAYIFYDDKNLASQTIWNLSERNANVTLTGRQDGSLFGWSVGNAGDTNGDGYGDVVVGAPGWNSDQGRTYVYLGGSAPSGNVLGTDEVEKERLDKEKGIKEADDSGNNSARKEVMKEHKSDENESTLEDKNRSISVRNGFIKKETKKERKIGKEEKKEEKDDKGIEDGEQTKIGRESSNSEILATSDPARIFRGHKYKLYTTSKSWSNAKDFCQERGGHLVTITTRSENTFIDNYVGSNDIHIGLKEIDSIEGSWNWTTREGLGYTNWDSYEPGGTSTDDVARMQSGGTWEDIDSGTSNYFVCEWENTSTYHTSFGRRRTTDWQYVEFSHFTEDFEDGNSLTPHYNSEWYANGSGFEAAVNTNIANSPTHSIQVGASSGKLTSWNISLSKTTRPVYLSWHVIRGSDDFSEDPDSGEDLIVEYQDESGNWNELAQYLGEGKPAENLTGNWELTSDAYHDAFQVRFRQTGGSGSGMDYWHIDDVYIHEWERSYWGDKAGEWELGNPTSPNIQPHSGDYCWVTNLTGDFDNNADEHLTTPPFTISSYVSEPTIEFWMYLDTMEDYDVGVLEVHNTTGDTTWNNIDPDNSLGNYDRYGSSSSGMNLSDTYVWAQDYPWTKMKFSIDSIYYGNEVEFRFYFESTSTISYPGWAIDDLSINGLAYNWSGTTNQEWTYGRNWRGNGEMKAPTNKTDAVIPSNKPRYPDVKTNSNSKTVLLEQHFDRRSEDGWSAYREGNQTNKRWIKSDNLKHPEDPPSGDFSMWHQWDGSDYYADDWYISPQIDATEYSSLQLEFKQFTKYGPYNHSLMVTTESPWPGSGEKDNKGGYKWVRDIDSAYKWETEQANLDDFAGEKIYIAFRYQGKTGSQGADWYIDDIYVNG